MYDGLLTRDSKMQVVPELAASYRQVGTTTNEFKLRQGVKFHTGEVLPELKLHYTTVGEPTGEPVLILHGTAGSGTGMLNPAFGGELFGPGQPLDASKYFIILPDAIGAGKSSKPSDRLRARFPKYNYDDMVLAQYRLVTEGLGVRNLRLVLGNSMGGVHTWLGGTTYPAFMVYPAGTEGAELLNQVTKSPKGPFS